MPRQTMRIPYVGHESSDRGTVARDEGRESLAEALLPEPSEDEIALQRLELEKTDSSAIRCTTLKRL